MPWLTELINSLTGIKELASRLGDPIISLYVMEVSEDAMQDLVSHGANFYRAGASEWATLRILGFEITFCRGLC